MSQDISKVGLEFIKKWEGCRLKAYRDSAGIWTIGYGHTAAAGWPKPQPGMVLEQSGADNILSRDLVRFEDRVERAFVRVIPQNVFDGAVSFDFNTGAIFKASWVKSWLAGDMKKAERALKLWNKAGGKVVQGLVNRRAAEADLIFRGKK